MLMPYASSYKAKAQRGEKTMEVKYEEGLGIERPVGVCQAVLCESVDLGIVPDKFSPGNTKHEVVLTWQLAESAGKWKDKAGKEHLFLQSKIFRASLNVKANLRKIIEGMLGKPLVLEDGKVVQLDKLNGVNCMLTITKPADSDYTKIEAAAPLMKGLEKIKPSAYTRPPWIDIMIAERKDSASPAKETASDVDLSDVASTL
jgi:hypothetical protein